MLKNGRHLNRLSSSSTILLLHQMFGITKSNQKVTEAWFFEHPIEMAKYFRWQYSWPAIVGGHLRLAYSMKCVERKKSKKPIRTLERDLWMGVHLDRRIRSIHTKNNSEFWIFFWKVKWIHFFSNQTCSMNILLQRHDMDTEGSISGNAISLKTWVCVLFFGRCPFWLGKLQGEVSEKGTSPLGSSWQWNWLCFCSQHLRE